jgi:transcriptional regulator with XRE-family HTH domain
MKLSEKIYYLRRKQNLSQEQLAEILGVSRQAVSKWEAEQSAPEIDKIVQLSEFFNVSTDYLLKENIVNINEECEGLEKGQRKVYIISTALIIVGALTAIVGWYEIQRLWMLLIGAIIQVSGIVLFETNEIVKTNDLHSKEVRRRFWRINIWMVALLPASCVGNLLARVFFFRPYPAISTLFFSLLLYIILCVCINVLLKKQS